MSLKGPRANPMPPLTLNDLSELPPEELRQTLAEDAGRTAQWLYAAACQGLVEAQTSLGQALLDGRGTPADGAAARRWFRVAAAAGHPAAMNMLGRCLERGWGGEQDFPSAAQWYRRAAEAGLDWAQYNLANMMMRGRGMPRDVPQSFRWFMAAAEQGHAKSINLVGRFLEEGWMGPPDLKQAAAWYQRAAEGGDFRGQYNLATLLVHFDRMDEAVDWFTRAGETGSRDFQRLAADQLLQRPEPSLRAVGLAIAASCCRGGAGEDYHRYGRALATGPDAQPRQARAWLQLAVNAGSAAARADLAQVEASLAPGSPKPRLLGLIRRG
jgi:TPR repeat protein